MKSIFTRLILSAAAPLFLAPCVSAQSDVQQQKDSLRRVMARTEGNERKTARNKLVQIYVAEVRQGAPLDSLMTLYDDLETIARQAGDPGEEGVLKFNRLIAYYNQKLYDEVIDRSAAVLAFLSENKLWKHYYQTSWLLCDAYRKKGDLDAALRETERFYNHAKAQEYRPGIGMAQLSFSRIYNLQRRFEDAEACLRECIAMLQDETVYLNYLATAYNNLASMLIGQQRYDEALEVARATEEVNRRYEEASRSPQMSAWYNLWLTYTDIYRQMGKFNEAQRYVDKVDSITGGTVRMYKERGHILYGKGRYRKALEMLDKASKESPGNLEVKGLKVMTLAQLREADRAVELFSETVRDLQKNYNDALASRLDEVRTQYEVDKYVAEKERNRNYFLFALAGCALLALLLGVAFYYNRIVTRKNIGLYKQIREQDRLEEELTQLRALAAHSGGGTAEDSTPLPGDRTQRELVERLREHLLRERNFAQAEINRDDLVAALGTNKNYFSEAVKAVTGKTPMEYIRTMQLEEARHLLDNHPRLTVEAVAYDCGFNAPNTFYRLFRKQYGISPAEYRRIAGTLGK